MRKLLLSFCLVILILSFSSNAIASSIGEKHEIIKPEKQSFSVTDKIVLISGKAPSGSEIEIQLYGTTDLTRRSFHLDKLPLEDDYILLSTETVKSGNMGFFQKQIETVSGINKIIVKFNVRGVENKEFIVLAYDPLKAEVGSPFKTSRDSRLLEVTPLMR